MLSLTISEARPVDQYFLCTDELIFQEMGIGVVCASVEIGSGSFRCRIWFDGEVERTLATIIL